MKLSEAFDRAEYDAMIRYLAGLLRDFPDDIATEAPHVEAKITRLIGEAPPELRDRLHEIRKNLNLLALGLHDDDAAEQRIRHETLAMIDALT